MLVFPHRIIGSGRALTSSHHRIINQRHALPPELAVDGRELPPDAPLARLLAGEDEGAVDVAVLDDGAREGAVEVAGEGGGSSIAGLVGAKSAAVSRNLIRSETYAYLGHRDDWSMN